MTLPAQDIVERLRARVDRWELNRDSARVSVPLGELRGVLAEIETYRTAFDGIEPSSRIAALEAEVGRLRLPEGTLAKHGSTITIEFDNAEYALRAFDAIEYAMSREPAALANEEVGR